MIVSNQTYPCMDTMIWNMYDLYTYSVALPCITKAVIA